jgi:probable F420-dependent oxidoreductase
MKVRIGFGPGVAAAYGLDGSSILGIIDACESLGWDSIWFSERMTGDVHDPMALMAATAARTTRLKFGPSVLVLPGRNPVVLAKELATIDALSNGRLIAAFGLGAGGTSEQAAFGVARAERAGRCDEAVALIKRLWTEESVTHAGRYFSLENVRLGTRPVQQPHPDVWFGGHSEAAARRVGRLGDGWLPSFIAPFEYKAKADLVRTEAERAGRAIDDEHFGALVPYVPEGADASAVLAAVATRRPDLAPDEIVAPDGDNGLRALIEAFIEQGASKFVVVPALRPRDWLDELGWLRASVAQVEN